LGPLGGVIFVVAIIAMVTLHELGHFLTAKHYGMKVTEFFFGFGPKLWSTRRQTPAAAEPVELRRPVSETEYGVKALPLGGYVKIVGMNPLEEISPEEEPRTFRGKPAGQKLIVLAAGSFTHLITGLLVLLVIYSFVGRPGEPTVPVLSQVPHAADGVPSAAERAGLRPGDRIVSVNGSSVSTWKEVSQFIASHAGQPAAFGVVRGTEQLNLETRLGERDGHGFLGVVVAVPNVRDSVPVGLVHSATAFWDIGSTEMKSLFSFFSPSHLSSYLNELAGTKRATGQESNRFVSPVGIVSIGSQIPDLADYLFLIALVSVFFGLFNLLPFFPLDGGWIAVTIYEKVASLIRRRRVAVDFRKLVPLTYAFVFILGFIFVTSLYLDITSPIRLNL
jgi:membrane-associated protease RseP (regulator of RpoE activity)